jgi:hypothetical protein
LINEGRVKRKELFKNNIVFHLVDNDVSGREQFLALVNQLIETEEQEYNLDI